MPNRRDYKFVWILGLIVAPVILVIIESFHPAGFTLDPGVFEFLRHSHGGSEQHKALEYFGPGWWFWLHMIQTPLVCLTAIGLALTVGAFADRTEANIPLAVTAWLARIAIFVFAVYYTVLDASGGIALGRLLQIANALEHATSYVQHGQVVICADALGKPVNCLSAEQMRGVELVLNQGWIDHWIGGVGSMISLTGSWALSTAA